MASDDVAGGDGAVDNGAVDNKAVDKSANNRAGGDAVLELDGLSVGYDRALVVRDLSLTVGTARWWRCSAPTAQGRRPRCARSPAC